VAEAVRGGSRVRRAQGGWGRAPPVQGRVWQWREGAVGGGGGARHYTTCGRDARERGRSGRKKGWGRVYSLMFVRPTHQPTNISGLAYVVAVELYVRRSPDEHKLHTSF
jgi:hypothetical protein